MTANLAKDYPAADADRFNIGLLHTSVDGRKGTTITHPAPSSQLSAHGYQYWALGHVHQRECCRQAPWIVFPGNLQGRHINEAGPKGATLVTVIDGRVARVEPIVLDDVRWEGSRWRCRLRPMKMRRSP